MDDVPVEGGELLIERLVDLQAVDIDDGAEIVQMILRSGHGGFPDLALSDLTVAQQGIDTVVLLCKLSGQSHADCGGDALAQRAGGHVDALDMTHVGMAGVMALDGAEELQILLREEAAQGQHRVQSRRAVAFGQHKAVAVRILRVGRVDLHDVEVQRREDVHRGEAAADMAGRGGMNGVKSEQPCLGSHDFELFAVKFFHSDHSFSSYFKTQKRDARIAWDECGGRSILQWHSSALPAARRRKACRSARRCPVRQSERCPARQDTCRGSA